MGEENLDSSERGRRKPGVSPADDGSEIPLDREAYSAVLAATPSPLVSDADQAAGSVAPDTRRLAVNALAGGGANAVKIGVQLLMLPLMAHLLGPAEFGIYALALPTVAFFMALADGGLGASLAREQEQSTVVWSTAFWLILGVGVMLALVVAIWGLVLADLSQEPRVQNVMGLLSVSFLLLAASVLPSARLTRQNRLVVISAADLTATLIGAAVAVGLAVWGAGAMSLAAQYVVAFLVRAVILNAKAFVRPTRDFRLSALKDHISTGSSLVGARLADFSGRLVENLLYGRMFGTAALGTFTFANQVPRFLCEAASGPLWAALYAHSLREDDERIAALHVKLVHLLALVLSPVAFLLSATIPGIVQMILGPAWEEAATLLRILIPFYALTVISGQSGAILLAKGAGWMMFWCNIVLVVGRVAAVCAGPWVGPLGIAWAMGGVQIVYSILMFCAPGRVGPSSAATLFRGLYAPTLAGAVAGIVCYFVVKTHQTEIVWISAGLLSGMCSYLLILFAMEGKLLRQDLNSVRRLLRRSA